MRFTAAIGATLLVAALAAPCLAGSLAGIWVGQIPARNGEKQDIAFQIRQDGSQISGKLYGDYRSSPIVEGKAEGDTVNFVVLMEEQAGNQINTTRLRFTGSVHDGELELVRERESSTNAGNGGDVQVRGNTKLTLKLRRLF
ncbi:MAG: hypothetical protein R2762_00790 [Bryobacteraceae bacterium]